MAKTPKTKTTTDIVDQLLSLNKKIDEVRKDFYGKAEDYLMSVLIKQKDEKIDLSDSAQVLYTTEAVENVYFCSEDRLEDLDCLTTDCGEVVLQADGFDYNISSLDMSSVCRLVEWVKTEVDFC